MSDLKTKPGKQTKRKSPRFIEIISDKVQERSEKKALQKQADQAYSAVLKRVQPWLDQGRGKLGWREEEFGAVDSKVKAAKKSKKKDIAGATALLEEAEEIGTTALYAIELRTGSQEALRTVLNTVIRSTSPEAAKIRQQVAGLEKQLESTDTGVLETVLGKAEALVDEVEDFEPEAQIEPKRLQLELKLQDMLRKEAIASLDLMRKNHGKTGDEVKSTVVLVLLEKEPKIKEAKDSMIKAKDNPKLTGATAPIQDLERRFGLAQKQIETACVEFRKRMGGQEGARLYQQGAKAEIELNKQDELRQATIKFEVDFAPVEKALARFLDLGTTDGPNVAEQIASTREETIDSGDFSNAAQTIDDLLKLLQFLTQSAIKDMKGDATALGNEIDGVISALEKQKKAAKKLAAAYDALILEGKQIKPQIKTSNPGAFKSARLLVEGLKEAGLGAAATRVAEFNGTCDEIALVTGDKIVAKEFPSEVAAITKAVQTVVDEADLHEFGLSVGKLAGLKKEADELQVTSDNLGHWRKGAEAQLNFLKKSIDEINAALSEKSGIFNAIKELIGGTDVMNKTVFGQDYTTVKDGYDKVGVDIEAMQKMLFAAQAEAFKISEMIKKTDLTGARDQLGTNVKAAETRSEEEAAKLKETEDAHAAIQKEYDDLVILLRQTRTGVANDPTGDKEELKEIEELRNQVRKKLKSKDFDGAARQLGGSSGNNGLTARLGKLAATPGGVTADSLKELQKVASFWDNAQKKVTAAIEAILVEARPVAQRISVDAKEIEKQSKGLSDKLFAFDFNEPVRTLLDKKSDLKKRKAAREAALKEVRSARAALLASPVAERLRHNPFGHGSPFTEYRDFLDMIEYNALRAVPPE